MPRRKVALIGLACAVLANCAAADGEPAGPGERPRIDVSRAATGVTPERLAGHWRCRELDPFPEQTPVRRSLRLEADGNAISETLLLLDGERPRGIDLALVLHGRWQVEGDRLVFADVVGTARPALGGADAAPVAGMEEVMAAFARQAESVPVEIFRLTADELVIREAEAEAGAATLACRRDA